MSIKTESYFPILLIVIGFACLFLFINNSNKKEKSIITMEPSEYRMKIESLSNENHKLRLYSDSLLRIPYSATKETIRIRSRKEIQILSDLNSEQLDSAIRKNW